MGKFSPTAGCHPIVTLSSRIPSTTKLLSALSSLTDCTHSSARLTSCDARLELLRFLFGAIKQIWRRWLLVAWIYSSSGVIADGKVYVRKSARKTMWRAGNEKCASEPRRTYNGTTHDPPPSRVFGKPRLPRHVSSDFSAHHWAIN